jgi:hypothetical protein
MATSLPTETPSIGMRVAAVGHERKDCRRCSNDRCRHCKQPLEVRAFALDNNRLPDMKPVKQLTNGGFRMTRPSQT